MNTTLKLFLAILLLTAAGTASADRDGRYDRGYHRDVIVDRGYYRAPTRVIVVDRAPRAVFIDRGYYHNYGIGEVIVGMAVGTAIGVGVAEVFGAILRPPVDTSPTVYIEKPRACYTRQPLIDPNGQPLYDQDGQPLTQLVPVTCPSPVTQR